MQWITSSETETRTLGERLAKQLAPGDIVFLTGDLGAGKSVLARGIARGLGITGAMPSPSFTLLQPYEGTMPVYHFDLYRLSDPDEFYASGLDEFLFGDGVSLVEWPENALTNDQATVRVQLHVLPDGKRAIDIDRPLP